MRAGKCESCSAFHVLPTPQASSSCAFAGCCVSRVQTGVPAQMQAVLQNSGSSVPGLKELVHQIVLLLAQRLSKVEPRRRCFANLYS